MGGEPMYLLCELVFRDLSILRHLCPLRHLIGGTEFSPLCLSLNVLTTLWELWQYKLSRQIIVNCPAHSHSPPVTTHVEAGSSKEIIIRISSQIPSLPLCCGLEGTTGIAESILRLSGTRLDSSILNFKGTHNSVSS